MKLTILNVSKIIIQFSMGGCVNVVSEWCDW